ncbi:MAG: hypothetical protein KIT76_08135 [Pseudolabrys sp.]|nr:hypothetical protein [Pseudolabrys sp.]
MQTTPSFTSISCRSSCCSASAPCQAGRGRDRGGAAAHPYFTNLGIRMVEREIVEAGLAFGADRRQLLFEKSSCRSPSRPFSATQCRPC